MRAIRNLSKQPEQLLLRSGRSVEVRAAHGEETLIVRAPSGVVELTVYLTDSGPRIRLEASALELSASGRVAIDCAQFEVRASDRIDLQAPDTRVKATVGDLELEANDAVKVMGEEIRLNCDGAERIPEWMRRWTKSGEKNR